MSRDEYSKVTLAIHKIAKAEEEFNNVNYFVVSDNSLNAINDLHIAMNVLAKMIVEDTDRQIKLHNQVKNKELT